MTLVGVTGHQQLPTQAIPQITEKLRYELSELGRVTAVTSLAAGADQLFATIVLDLGGELEVIVPSAGYESTFSDSSDLESYRRLLSRARTVRRLSFENPSEQAFFAAGMEMVKACERLFAVWDGQPAQGFGGTADVVHYAERQGVPVSVVWPSGASD
jgi:hypothetical protein